MDKKNPTEANKKYKLFIEVFYEIFYAQCAPPFFYPYRLTLLKF